MNVLDLEPGSTFKVRKGNLPNGGPAFGPEMTRGSGRMATYTHEGRTYSIALSGDEEFVVIKKEEEQQVPAQSAFQLKFA